MTLYDIKRSETFQYCLKRHCTNAHFYNEDARTKENGSLCATSPSITSRKDLNFTFNSPIDLM